MTDTKRAFYGLLSGSDRIRAVVGAYDVYAMVAPQNTDPPFLVYTRISGAPEQAMTGPTGFRRDVYQVDVYAGDPDVLAELGAAVELLLDGYSDGDIEVTAMDTGRDFADEPDDASDEWDHRTLMEFEVWSGHAAPATT